MKWSNEDIELVEKFIDIKNKGYYVSGEQLTQVYNRVLKKNANVTNCGSCLRQRVNELEAALKQFKKKIELENKSQEEVAKEVMKEKMAAVRAAKKKKE